MKELLEYKMDANDMGNLIHPNWVDHGDCGHFYNPADYTYVGIRLSEKVKVPDSVTRLSSAELLTRALIPGIMLKLVDDEMVQMTEEEIEDFVAQFCSDRGIV